jgi:hypothetical protein
MKPVDEVKAPEAEEVLAYPLTRDELLVLARHWAKEDLDLQLFFFFTGCTGGIECRTMAYAGHRLRRIADLLGLDAVQRAVAEVEEEARRDIGDEEWRGFTGGTEEAWDRAIERTEQDHAYLDRKREDKETLERAFAYLRDHPGQVYFDEAGDLWYLSEPSPSGDGRPAGKLVLRVTIPRGGSAFVTGYELERPPWWTPPYRLP